MKKILLVDDDQVTHAMVKGCLRSDFALTSCYGIQEAQKLFEQDAHHDLILIDRLLPDGDGMKLCSFIRNHEQTKNVPIIFLSSQGTEVDKVSGLYAGADDYIAKPFSVLELRARIDARLRSYAKQLCVTNVTIDLDTHQVSILAPEAKIVNLTRIEYKILVLMAQNLEKVYSRETLIDKIWGPGNHVTDRAVDTHMSHLRQKMSDAHLVFEALRGEGYRLLLKRSSFAKAI